MNLKGCFSKESDHWATPTKMYDYFMNTLKAIDPCPLHSKEDNLNKIYNGRIIFINPPYSDIKSWTKFIKNNCRTNLIYLLIPARTDTKYFHELMNLEHCEKSLYFIKGRLHFNNSKYAAPFPSVIISFVCSKESKINCDFIDLKKGK